MSIHYVVHECAYGILVFQTVLALHTQAACRDMHAAGSAGTILVGLAFIAFQELLQKLQ